MAGTVDLIGAVGDLMAAPDREEEEAAGRPL
jgi:hypothetical protein